MLIRITLPEKLAPLYEPRRYKVMHGGRGGGKSHGVAQVLLDMAARNPLRVLCAREIQKSMRDSVHRLLRDYIVKLGLESFYEITDTEIRGQNGSLFLFTGLQSHTVDSIKSFEGVDVVWVEEAHGVSKRSWDVLIPTIRKEGSEIWLTLNPDMETDETYQRFIATPSPDTWVVEINWRDNPWFPQVLDDERQKAKRAMLKEDYEHIWEGKARKVAAGAIYRYEIEQLYADGRVRDVPYDPSLPVHTVWDLGWNDAMTIGMVQRGPQDIRVIDYIEDSHRTLDWYVTQLEKRPYRWGTDFLPHDGRTKNFQTGKSTEERLRELNRKPYAGCLSLIPVEEGIKGARMEFPKCYFDQHKTARLLECLKRYQRRVHQQTNEPMEPLHDEYSHGCLDADTLVTLRRGDVRIADVRIGDEVLTPAGWAAVLNAGPTKIATDLIEIETEDGVVILATPEHRFFTTRGVVTADTLRHDDRIHNYLSAPCLPSHLIKYAGYRGAVIESFKASAIGTGRPVISTEARLADGRAYSTLKSIGRFMASLQEGIRLAHSMGISRTPTPTTGPLLRVCASASMMCRSSTAYASTASPMATTRPIERVEASTCTAMCGSRRTGRSPRFITSITRITTKQTTRSTTSNCSPTQNIPDNTLLRISGSAVTKMFNSFWGLVSVPRSGTAAKKAAHGTAATPSRLGKSANGSRSSASNAEQSSPRPGQREPSFATRIARLRRFAPEGVLVYDLTVEKHHCYFANGLPVSNSDMFRYLAQAVPLMEVSTTEYEEPEAADWRV